MTSRNHPFGLARALSFATVLTLPLPAWAQGAAATPNDEAPTVEGNIEESNDTTLDAQLGEPEEAPAPEPVEPVAEPEETPEQQEAAEEEEAAEKEVEEETEAEGKETKPEDTVVNNTWGVRQLRITETPWTAYPSKYIRGLTYGSLWRTFHGQQWPYMPNDKHDDKNMHITFSGYIWNDLSNTKITPDEVLETNAINRWNTQSRGLLRVTPTLNVGKGYFVQGNAELVVQGDMQPDVTTGVLATTDDLWIRFGKWDLFDITVGRFQGWEIANHYGLGLDWATLEREGAYIVGSSIPKPTDGYGLDYFWDRQNFLMGGYALHVYPFPWLRGEVLGHVGAGHGNATNPYQFDVRPSVIFDIGYLKLKAGYEYGKALPQSKSFKTRDTKNGFGVAAQVVLAPYVEFGASFARGYQDVIDKDGDPDLDNSNTAQTVGGFINVSPGWEPLIIGGGAFLKSWKNFHVDTDTGPHNGKVDTNDQWLLYGAVQYNLFRQLYLKFIFSHASNRGGYSTVNTGSQAYYVNNSIGGRLRIEYLF